MNRRGYAFTDEDLELIRTLKAKLAIELGKCSEIAAIRFALRQAVNKQN